MPSDTFPWRSLLAALACMVSAAGAAAPATQRAGITGVLLGPDGRTLSGTEVWLVTREMDVQSLPPHLYAGEGASVRTTAVDGRFAFDSSADDFSLLVATDAGCALVKPGDLADGGRGPVTLRLERWASIRATVTVGGQPTGAGVGLSTFNDDPRLERGRLGPFILIEKSTDATGQCAFDHLFPGPYQFGGHATITVAAGETTEVTIPIGRPVTARLALPAVLSGVDWRPNGQEPGGPDHLPTVTVPADLWRRSSGEWSAWYAGWSASPAGQAWATEVKAARQSLVDGMAKHDGQLQMYDVPIGTHRFTERFFPSSKAGYADYDHPLAAVTYTMVVPPMTAGSMPTPCDVGVLRPVPTATLLAGQPVPDIAFQTADGVSHQLSQYRGKVVLLDFWGAWCGQCMAQLPKVKAIVDAHRADPDFVAISLDVRDAPEKWRAAVAAHGMDWPQARLGSTAEAWQAKLMGVTGYPSLWLIGRDGRVVAHDWETESVRPYVDGALARPTGPSQTGLDKGAAHGGTP